MEITIAKTGLAEITAFRNLFLQENNFQFIHNKCHDYGWADTYLFTIDGVKAGYGSVWGQNRREDRDTIFEFYLLKPYRKMAELVFSKFIGFQGLFVSNVKPMIRCFRPWYTGSRKTFMPNPSYLRKLSKQLIPAGSCFSKKDCPVTK